MLAKMATVRMLPPHKMQKTSVEKETITDSERNEQRNYYLIHY